MAQGHIHYEAAFEDYLRSRGLPYLPVDEKRKAIFAGARVKSFDFLLYHPARETWLVDIKGRKFPYVHEGRKRYWENWITRDDLEGLTSWQAAFGGDFTAVLTFAYLLTDTAGRLPTVHLHSFRDALYAFMCIRLDEYQRLCRRRSPKWDTVCLSTRQFRRLARPIQATLDGLGLPEAAGAYNDC